MLCAVQRCDQFASFCVQLEDADRIGRINPC